LKGHGCRSISSQKDGFQLPEIMRWIKRTFAVRFNRRVGRTGHLWDDRYWSCVLEEEPPEWAGRWIGRRWREAEPPTKADIARARKWDEVSPSQGERGAEGVQKMHEVTRTGEGVVRGEGAERKKTTELHGETQSLGGVMRKSV
jgi:hypothetical protein